MFPVTLALIVLGNFRGNWVGYALAALILLPLLPARKRRLVIVASIPVLLASALTFYACRNVRIGDFGETVAETVGAKFKNLLQYRNDPNVIWRFHSYQAGLRIWSEHPLLAAGWGANWFSTRSTPAASRFCSSNIARTIRICGSRSPRALSGSRFFWDCTQRTFSPWRGTQLPWAIRHRPAFCSLMLPSILRS